MADSLSEILISTDQQKLLDHVVEQLAIQGHKATINNVCSYRTDDGDRCAAGWCLNKTGIEAATGRSDSWMSFLDRLHLFDEVSQEPNLMIQEMQNIHDTSNCRSELATRLAMLARYRKLSTAAVENHMHMAWQVENAGDW